jgi:DNA-directed RNA polymerase specialized sigma24 family protein
MDSRDVIHALRLWLPEGKSVAGVRDDLAGQLATAFAEFERTAPGSGIGDAGEIMPLAATAAGRALLQEAVDAAKSGPAAHLPTEPLRQTLAELAWPDLLLTAACAHKNDAANRALVDLIEEDVRPALIRKWGRDRGEEIADELPQKLHLFDERGLNRGRVRLLAYGGRSRLATWLRAVAHQGAIDRWRRRRREQPVDELPEPTGRAGDGEPGDQIVEEEELEMVSRVGRMAFEQLMAELPRVSEQQYRFAYFRCVQGLDNNAIAEQLDVGKSRVTELSQQVFRRLIAIMRRLAPELAEISDDASRDRRRKMEEALQAWFGQDASNTGDVDAAASDAQPLAAPSAGRAGGAS